MALSRPAGSGTTPRQRTVGIFDAGIGGLPIAAAIRAAHPRCRLVYLGDAGRRPYGPQPAHLVRQYVGEAESFFADAGCDVWVVACNTASVVAGPPASGAPARVDMVTAVTTAVPPPSAGPLGILATAGTVASNAFVTALPDHEVVQVATEELLRLAETASTDSATIGRLAEEAFDELGRRGCRAVVLACTDFTCIIDDLLAAAGDMTVIDPLRQAVALVGEAMARLPSGSGAEVSGADRLCLTGPHPADVLDLADRTYGLTFDRLELVTLTARATSP